MKKSNNIKHDLYMIGEISEKTGTSCRMIRYYEKLGFLIGVKRNENGYRLYNNEHIRVVSKIPEFLLLGFSLEEMLLAWKVKQVFLTKKSPEKHLKSLAKNTKELIKLKDKVKRILSAHQKYVDYLKRIDKYMDKIKE